MTRLIKKKKPVPVRGPEYAEKNRVTTRRRYRKIRGEEYEMVGCLRSLAFFADDAEHLLVSFGGKPEAVAPVYKLKVVADLLQMSYQALWRQISLEAIPAPILIHRMGKRELLVYHREEVRTMLTIIGEHKKRFTYYRQDHTETRESLASTITTVRQEMERTLWPPSASPPVPQPQRPKRLPPKLARKKP